MKPWLRGICLLSISFALFTQCEPCPTCGDLVNQPFIKLTIDPRDSLAMLSPVIAEATRETRRLTAAIAEDGISDERKEELITALDSVNAYLAALNKRKALLAIKKVRLDTVWTGDGKSFYVNKDTSDVFRLPLNPFADSTEWIIQLFGEYDTLKVHYERRETNEDYRLIQIAENVANLKEENYTFDTAYLKLSSPDRIATETTIIAEH